MENVVSFACPIVSAMYVRNISMITKIVGIGGYFLSISVPALANVEGPKHRGDGDKHHILRHGHAYTLTSTIAEGRVSL